MAELSLCCLWRSMGGKLASQTHRWSKAQSHIHAHTQTYRSTHTHSKTLSFWYTVEVRPSFLSPPLFASKCLSTNLVIEWELQKCLSKLRLYCHVSRPRTTKFWPPSTCGKSSDAVTAFCMWTYGEGAEHEYAHTRTGWAYEGLVSEFRWHCDIMLPGRLFYTLIILINYFFSSREMWCPNWHYYQEAKVYIEYIFLWSLWSVLIKIFLYPLLRQVIWNSQGWMTATLVINLDKDKLDLSANTVGDQSLFVVILCLFYLIKHTVFEIKNNYIVINFFF